MLRTTKKEGSTSNKLAQFIKTYLIIESGEELVNRILPETSLVMALRWKGNVRMQVIVNAGLTKQTLTDAAFHAGCYDQQVLTSKEI